MLERFIKWICGYLYVIIKGKFPERFLNLCSARNISIWNVKKTEQGYEFCISIKEFKKLPLIARKTKTRPYIIKRVGFPFYINKIKKRQGFWIGSICFFILLYSLSSFIWDIQLSGQYTYTKEGLVKYLKTINVYAGMKKKNINCSDIETKIRETYKDIGWVSVELKGTKLLIKIQETNMPSLYVTDNVPKHLIASRDGIVNSIITRTGTPMVKAGDEVKKGDILISGIVKILGDSGELLRSDTVLADGDVIIEAKTSYYDEVAKKYRKKEYTGKEKWSYEIDVFSYQLKQLYPIQTPIFDVITFENYWKDVEEQIKKVVKMDTKDEGRLGEITKYFQDKINKDVTGKEEQNKINNKEVEKQNPYDILKEKKEVIITSTLKLPINLQKTTYKEYIFVEREYKKEEQEQILQKKFDYYIKKLMEKGVLIGENSVKIETEGTLATMSGTFTILEKANKFQEVQEVENNEWRIIETDEYSRNNN